jgi:hypothetical protein
VLAQDIPVDIYLIDNGSIDDGFLVSESTKNWTDRLQEQIEVSEQYLQVVTYPINISPVKLSNEWMERLFAEYETVLGIPNDVVAPPNLYSELLRWPHGVVTAGMHGAKPPIVMTHEEVKRVHGDVHLSVPMVRKSAYEALIEKDGYFFDPHFFMYCSDCDLKVRLAQVGISTAQTNLLCWHYGGASHRLGHQSQVQLVNDRTWADREYFDRKWGWGIGSPEYNAIIAKLN